MPKIIISDEQSDGAREGSVVLIDDKIGRMSSAFITECFCAHVNYLKSILVYDISDDEELKKTLEEQRTKMRMLIDYCFDDIGVMDKMGD